MMNVFKRKSVYAAVLASLGAVGVSGTANAVHINPDGLGQVLVYPYYTVRGGNDTYLSVVNTTASTKAIKVRFLEGKNSREVLDFNLYLSPFDVWTGAVVATTDGAKLVTSDKSCTTPAIAAAGQAFVNYQFTGANADGEDQTLDRTREGYFELIEMGNVTNVTHTAWIKHNSAGTPANCGALQNITAMTINAPTGGLTGTASLMNPASGTDYGYDAVAIDQWSALPQWTRPDSTFPSIASGSVMVSNVFTSGGVQTATWATNRDAVSATMMHNNIINEFMLDTATLSGTDWVVTMPTKNQYVGLDRNFANATTRMHDLALDPFTEQFGIEGSCDPVGLQTYNREEAEAGVTFSPLPPAAVNALCWEANVVTFNNSNVLASTNTTNVPTTYTNGWMNMSFTQIYNVLTPLAGLSHYGLPVVGFMVQDFTNGNAAPGIMATYGGNFNHDGTRDIR